MAVFFLCCSTLLGKSLDNVLEFCPCSCVGILIHTGRRITEELVEELLEEVIVSCLETVALALALMSLGPVEPQALPQGGYCCLVPRAGIQDFRQQLFHVFWGSSVIVGSRNLAQLLQLVEQLLGKVSVYLLVHSRKLGQGFRQDLGVDVSGFKTTADLLYQLSKEVRELKN
jgi:hypothetical protein